jgi:hypothetical protein
MRFEADVLIVAGDEDRVAARLVRDFENDGRRVLRLDGPSAARLFTVQVGPDEIVVSPSPPIFVRASAWWHPRGEADADERFLRAEAYATFWAATALSKAPVINRAGRNGGGGRLQAGAIAAAVAAAERVVEIHASGPEMCDGGADRTLWGEDLEFRIGTIASLRRNEPLRARRLNPAALYEIVTVVGDRGFAATTDPRTAELALVEQSLAACANLAVHFATVTWAIDEQGATPVRLNPSPDEAELRYAWREVSRALRLDLTG